MRVRYRALVLPAVVLGIFLLGGCGPVNEENVADTKSAPINPNAPKLNTYADAAKYQAEQTAKTGKGKGAKPANPVEPPVTKTPEK
jgi:outer membrane murein-binding lipoprotein Lpp